MKAYVVPVILTPANLKHSQNKFLFMKFAISTWYTVAVIHGSHSTTHSQFSHHLTKVRKSRAEPYKLRTGGTHISTVALQFACTAICAPSWTNSAYAAETHHKNSYGLKEITKICKVIIIQANLANSFHLVIKTQNNSIASFGFGSGCRESRCIGTILPWLDVYPPSNQKHHQSTTPRRTDPPGQLTPTHSWSYHANPVLASPGQVRSSSLCHKQLCRGQEDSSHCSM